MNKIKKIVIQFFKENYKELIVLILLYLLFVIPINYSIYAPGGLINMNRRIESKDKLYKSKGSINLTYVSLIKGTIPTYLIAKILPSWDLVKNESFTYDGNGDVEETVNIDHYYLMESVSNAYKVAYNEANIDYKIKKSNNYVTYIFDEAKTDLKKFDKIVKYDNIEFTSFSEMQKYITNKNVGDKVSFMVMRDNKEINCYAELIDINGSPKVGLTAVVINDYDSDINVKVKMKKNEAGTSNGFMTALAIYNAITKQDITNGRKIAGTGEIDDEGNVGEIGGVTYKLQGAYNKHADVFLVPEANYNEAYSYKKKHDLDIEVVSISNFKEAINYLNQEG